MDTIAPTPIDQVDFYTPLQSHFLTRLLRLMVVRREWDLTPDPDPWVRELVDNAILATVRDCADQGIGDVGHMVVEMAVQGDPSRSNPASRP